MPRKRIVLIAVIISLIIVLTSIILRFFVFNSSGDPFKSRSPLENGLATPPPAGGSNSTALDPVQPLPVSYNHPAVIGAAVNYIFEGNLKEIKGKTPDFELVTDVQITNGPKSFITGKNTKYYKETRGVRTPTSVANLKPGQRIKLNTFFDLYRKTWTVVGVAILQK